MMHLFLWGCYECVKQKWLRAAVVHESYFMFSNLWAGSSGWGRGTPTSSGRLGDEEGRDLWPDVSSFPPIVANRSAIGVIRNSLSDIWTQYKRLCHTLSRKHLWISVGGSHTSPRLCVPDSQLSVFPTTSGSDHLSLPWTPSHRLNTQTQWTHKHAHNGQHIVWLFKQTAQWIAAGSTNSIFFKTYNNS